MAENNKNISSEELNPVKVDIILLLILALCILLFVSVIGFCGIIGIGVRFVLFGLLGLPAFAFPFVLFFACSFAIANKGNRIFIRKLIGLIGIFVFSCALCQIIMKGFDPTYFVFQSFLDSAADHLGGGFLGGCIVQLLGMLIGLIGTYIVLIIGMIIFAMILTQKPLVSKMKDRSKVVYEKARVNIEKQKSLGRTRRMEKLRDGNDYDSDDYDDDDYDRARASRRNLLKDTQLEAEPGRRTELNSDIFDSYINGKSAAVNESAADPYTREARNKVPEFVLPQLDIPSEMFDFKEETSENAEDTEVFEFQTEDLYSEDVREIIYREESSADEPLKGEASEDEPLKGEASEDKPLTGSASLEEPLPGEHPSAAINSRPKKQPKPYRLPPLSLLEKGSGGNASQMRNQIRETAEKLQSTLNNFGVDAKVVNASCGPTVTRYEIEPAQGVKVSKIVGLTDDIKLNLAASDIRIEAPIPGKAAIGIEVPNKTNNVVALSELINTPEFKNSKSKLSITVGKDLAGKPVISDIAKMPHLLIAGSTGSGKSVCVNTFIMSILYKAKPDEVRFIMIDPKVVELKIYNGIPHLLSPVVTDPKKAAGALQWAVGEMTRRYNLFAEFNVRDLKGYNAKVKELEGISDEGGEEAKQKALPQIVIIVDELADLMMAAPGEVEESICRLAQLARAAGMHLIIATQRPSVNVITGLIKANMPSRIALSVTSGIDSRVIIDMNGAEKLLGKGDMLFYPAGYSKPARVQGGYVSDEEIERVVEFIAKRSEIDEEESAKIAEEIANAEVVSTSAAAAASGGGDDRDVYFVDAGRFIIEKDKASIGMLQRVFKIGFNRAARIMDQLCDAGVVGEEEGTKPRKILMSLEQFENYLEEN